MRSLWRRCCLALLLPMAAQAAGECHQPPPALAAPNPRATLALVIDDMGYQRHNGQAVVDLPGRLTVAILPHTPYGAELAQAAHRAGKEVILHAPMSNLTGIPLDRGGLTADQPREEFEFTLQQALHAIPHVRGVNNHMGSELTQRREQMDWVMQLLKRQQLYFLDSRTSAGSVAAVRAAAHGVPHLSRHVFLDNVRDSDAIDREFSRLVRRALEQGLAVGIGHPYPETISYLQQALPALRCQGIRLALVSELLPRVKQTLPPASLAGTGLFSTSRDRNTASLANFDAPLRHIGLGLGHSVLTEVEDTGG